MTDSFPLPSEAEIRQVFMQGGNAAVELGLGLVSAIRLLEARVQVLEDKLAKNSRNSGKPPGSDGLRKPNTSSLRKKTGRKPGGIVGHKGGTLEPVENPRHSIAHKVEVCSHCEGSLVGVEAVDFVGHQVFDVPYPRLEVTEHRAEVKQCPACGGLNTARFPAEAESPTQYGPGFHSLAAYLTNHQLLPLKRTCDLLEDLFGVRPSEAALVKMNQRLAEKIQPTIDEIKEKLVASPVIQNDETGIRVEGKTHWLHSASTKTLTCYSVHEKRGKPAMDEADILTRFRGVSVHDGWKPYFRFQQCLHALCNQHHLRDLRFIVDQYRQTWAQEMTDLLLEIKKQVEDAKALKKNHLDPPTLASFEDQYGQIIKAGLECNPTPPKTPGKRGRPKQSPPKNLLDRLQAYKTETLAFMHNFQIPFTNNQAEQDIRMMKVRQKISGTFRTKKGAQTFTTIRTYTSTSQKQDHNIVDALKKALTGNPITITN